MNSMFENFIVIDNWKLTDLFKSNFWLNFKNQLLSNSQDIENIIKNPEKEIIDKKDQLIYFLWSLFPDKLKEKLFENDYGFYYIWSFEIDSKLLVLIHDFLVKKNYKKLNEFILQNEVYNSMLEAQDQAEKDINEKDAILLKFYDKISTESVISLNTPEYVMVSGIDKNKVNDLTRKLIEKQYKLSDTLSYKLKHKNIPIYVFNKK